uniref:Uncharacterized protein n=1 Tax=Podoviridae sp. ctxkP1 TaxID=2826591 RepID=A0A8S5QT82_9CAUD|nr:MAG TPA: hypothetical protein [Podoviridae sp. ctxkP1]
MKRVNTKRLPADVHSFVCIKATPPFFLLIPTLETALIFHTNCP